MVGKRTTYRFISRLSLTLIFNKPLKYQTKSAQGYAFLTTVGAIPLGKNASTGLFFRKKSTIVLPLLSTHLTAHPFLFGYAISPASLAFNSTLHGRHYRHPVPSQLIKTLVAGWVERVGGLTKILSLERKNRGGLRYIQRYEAARPNQARCLCLIVLRIWLSWILGRCHVIEALVWFGLAALCLCIYRRPPLSFLLRLNILVIITTLICSVTFLTYSQVRNTTVNLSE